MLVPLLLDLNKVNIESVITFGCLYVRGIYLFSSAKTKMLCSTQNASTYIRTILHSHEALGLFFHDYPMNEGPVLCKNWTFVWFRLAEGT